MIRLIQPLFHCVHVLWCFLQIGAMSSKIEQLVEECEQHKRKTKGLQKEIDSQKEAVEAKQKVDNSQRK